MATPAAPSAQDLLAAPIAPRRKQRPTLEQWARSEGWTSIGVDPTGTLVGLPPRPSWPGDFQVIRGPFRRSPAL